jgi:hypothetical protein
MKKKNKYILFNTNPCFHWYAHFALPFLAKVYGYAIFLLEYMLLSNYKTEMMNVYL